MKCPVCNFNAGLARWILVNPTNKSGSPTTRVNVHTLTNATQYDKPIYACPVCGVIRIPLATDR